MLALKVTKKNHVGRHLYAGYPKSSLSFEIKSKPVNLQKCYYAHLETTFFVYFCA